MLVGRWSEVNQECTKSVPDLGVDGGPAPAVESTADKEDGPKADRRRSVFHLSLRYRARGWTIPLHGPEARGPRPVFLVRRLPRST